MTVCTPVHFNDPSKLVSTAAIEQVIVKYFVVPRCISSTPHCPVSLSRWCQNTTPRSRTTGSAARDAFRDSWRSVSRPGRLNPPPPSYWLHTCWHRMVTWCLVKHVALEIHEQPELSSLTIVQTRWSLLDTVNWQDSVQCVILDFVLCGCLKFHKINASCPVLYTERTGKKTLQCWEQWQEIILPSQLCCLVPTCHWLFSTKVHYRG